jgi:Zn-dependent M28 family amino/carboxypeptidase
MKQLALAVLISLFVISCSGADGKSEKKSENIKPLVVAPAFDAQQAYDFVQKQVDFGPRVPNTHAHKEASAWFKEQFESFGASVYMQEFQSMAYDGKQLDLVNVIASFNPDAKKRILLTAHWDTRPFADRDAEDKNASLDGANDGGSGVGVLMEVARVIGSNDGPKVGVDIILFDGEDGGEHADHGSTPLQGGLDTWWCLGSQYWSKNKHKSNYSAYYGILLDMVGAPDATFYYDAESEQNAARVQKKVWDMGIQLGHDNYFKPKRGFGGIIDDHVYVNKYARIPMIDIIDHRPGGQPYEFTPAWHTQNDNMDNIDKKTLGAVGEVLLSLLYNE